MKAKSPFFIVIVFLLTSCYNPYKGFDGVDDKGMGRTPPSMELSKSYDKKQKRMERRHKKMMKKRREKMGTPVEKDKEKGLSPF